MSRHKLFEPYEDHKGSGQWFFDTPNSEPFERIKNGPYPDRERAEFDAEIEAASFGC